MEINDGATAWVTKGYYADVPVGVFMRVQQLAYTNPEDPESYADGCVSLCWEGHRPGPITFVVNRSGESIPVKPIPTENVRVDMVRKIA